MYNLRKELINTIMKSLKIDNNPFNTTTIQNLIVDISDDKLQAFYQSLFGADHSYLNGIDRVAKVAEQYKTVQFDNVEQEAKELIELCEGLNTQIRKDAERMGEDFKKLVYSAKFPKLDTDKIAILNSVKPYRDFKELIINIRHFQTANDALNAFMSAIKFVDNSLTAIESSAVRKMLS